MHVRGLKKESNVDTCTDRKLKAYFCYLHANMIKRVFNHWQTSVLSLSTVGSLVDHRAYKALHLSGTSSLTTGTSPPSCQLLDNQLYISTRLHGSLVYYSVLTQDSLEMVKPFGILMPFEFQTNI